MPPELVRHEVSKLTGAAGLETKIGSRMLSMLYPSLRVMLATLVVCACLESTAQAQNAVVVVNGDPITNFDIEQRMKLLALSNNGKTPGRQEALEELINDRVKVKEGKKFSLDLTPVELETQYATMG